MLELMHVGGCSIGPFLETIVAKLIHDDVVVLLDEGLDGAEACEPTCRVDQEAVDVPVLGQLLLQLHEIPKSKNLKYLVAPKARGLPAELTPNYLAA